MSPTFSNINDLVKLMNKNRMKLNFSREKLFHKYFTEQGVESMIVYCVIAQVFSLSSLT